MKKILALALAAVMVMALCGVAFAAPTDASSSYTVDSVTVSGIKEGNTLTLYKIIQFNLDAATNEFGYTLATDLPTAYDTVEELAALSPSSYTLAGVTATIRIAADNLAKLIADGTVTPIGSAVTATAGSGNTATISDLPAGWYVAVVNGTADNSIIYQNMIINAMPVIDNSGSAPAYASADDISFEVKHTTTTITKGVGESPDHTADVQTTDAYGVGNTVPYEIKTTIPNYPNPSTYAKFVITDTPTNLVDTLSTVTVTVEGDSDTGSTAGSIDGKFTVAATSANGFTVTFVKDYILAHPGAAVTVNYSAVITADALLDNETGLTAENTAKITFNPNPNFDEDVEPEDETEDYTYGLDVLKYEDGDTSKSLTGAKFILYAADGTTVVRAETEVDENGHISWNKLAAGDYKLVETVAPVGYRLDSTPIDITINSTTAANDDRTTDSVTETYFLQKDVPNTPGATLPSTGGIGTTIFYVSGLIMVLGASIILISRRRADAE